MELKTGLGMRAEQRLALLPSMLQSIEVLQMATVDLLQHIDLELSRNETLESTPASSPEPEVAAPAATDRFADDPDGMPFDFRRGSEDLDDARRAMFESVAAPTDDLFEHVRGQLLFRDLPPAMLEAVLVIAGMLDDRGLIEDDDARLATELAGVVDAGLIPEARAVLAAIEPRGLGSRTPSAAMLAQLADTDPDRPLVAALLAHHLEPLARRRHAEVARSLGIEVDELAQLLERMRGLDPHPGARFRGGAAAAIRPDLHARIVDGLVEVRLDENDVPELAIREDYASMAKDRSVGADVRRYLRGKLDSARTLISAVEHRRETLLRVGLAVLARQRAFLDFGRSRIAPLRMSDVAAELGMHTSTVSRAIAGKHVGTVFGMFRMRDFFDGGRNSTGATAERTTGRSGIQHQIELLIGAEDPARPLSDDDVVALLRTRGIEVARRTVAKYRKDLGIASTWERRAAGDRP